MRSVCAPSVARTCASVSQCVRATGSMWARRVVATSGTVNPAPRATLLCARTMCTSSDADVLESQDGPLLPTTRPLRNVAVIAHVDHGTSVEPARARARWLRRPGCDGHMNMSRFVCE